jgi:tetratricopeptide (TPR) repeat protein
LIEFVDLPPIEAELAGLGLDRSEPGATANLGSRPRHAFRHVRWPAGFFIAGRLDLLGHALELEPNQAELAMELAWLYATGPETSRDPSRALSLARRATELAPAEPLCWSTLALVDYRLGRWTDAAEAARRSIQLNPEDAAPYGRIILAMCDHQLGRLESALVELDRADRRIADHDGPNPSPAADLRALRAEAEVLLEGTSPGNLTDRGR